MEGKARAIKNIDFVIKFDFYKTFYGLVEMAFVNIKINKSPYLH